MNTNIILKMPRLNQGGPVESNPVVQVKNLNAWFGKQQVLTDINVKFR